MNELKAGKKAPEKEYYKILAVHEDATLEEINIAYKAKAKELHPDTGGSEQDFKKLQEAYQCLKDEKHRKI